MAQDKPDLIIDDALLREKGRKIFAGECGFFWGAETLQAVPEISHLPEIAFAGRSNVGKSSLINALTGRTTLVRTSKSPGHTKQLNFFNLSDAMVLVDMPGYGFAKASKDRIANWDNLIKTYLKGRPTLRKVCLLIDSRHGFKDVDHDVLKLLNDSAVSVQVVLTKIDEVKRDQQARAVTLAEEVVHQYASAYPKVIATSADKNIGLEGLRAMLVSVL
jgi:GTP-binding protein